LKIRGKGGEGTHDISRPHPKVVWKIASIFSQVRRRRLVEGRPDNSSGGSLADQPQNAQEREKKGNWKADHPSLGLGEAVSFSRLLEGKTGAAEEPGGIAYRTISPLFST